ncbi:M56 family metallopeptidase [Carboxydothermus hydrogenoformans]|uniref:Peptidase, homolog n=1 Tax=Carboxydothermus hydrogenoformans (strain ATCC BAA-161 / DSM 6008 / Z-2901) TaxID=246194 RepID=Q3AAB8_CARHZ|nr:M56 family metallopeptidase [Carboxydothermus hydrogenoformans]ABB15444.1 peptidase, homolog [Carboxydothermus hydrogenoformans Z-2901]
MSFKVVHTFFLYALFGPLFGYTLLLLIGKRLLKNNSYFWSEILTIPLLIPVLAVIIYWGKPCPLLTLANPPLKFIGGFLCFLGDGAAKYFTPVFIFAAFYGLHEIIRPYFTFNRFLKAHRLKKDEQLNGILAELKEKMGIKKEVFCYLAPGNITIFTFKFDKPVVIVGEEYAKRLDFEELKAVLAHELAHIKANDSLIISLCQFATYLYFFVPGLKKYFEKILLFRELRADKVALGYLGKKEPLASALVKTYKFGANASWIGFALDLGGDFEIKRMQAIIESDLKIPRRNFTYFAVMTLIVSLSLIFLYFIC